MVLSGNLRNLPEASRTFHDLPGPIGTILGHSGTFRDGFGTFRNLLEHFQDVLGPFSDVPELSGYVPGRSGLRSSLLDALRLFVGRFRDVHRLTGNYSG